MIRGNPFARPFPPRPFGRSVVLGHGRTALFVLVALLFVFSFRLALAYAAAIFVTAVTYHFTTDRIGIGRRGPRWTLARWTLDQAVLLFLASTACFLVYNATRGWTLLSPRVLLYVSLPTVAVGMIPIVLSGLAVQARAARRSPRR
jgi:hypothetical protein